MFAIKCSSSVHCICHCMNVYIEYIFQQFLCMHVCVCVRVCMRAYVHICLCGVCDVKLCYASSDFFCVVRHLICFMLCII